MARELAALYAQLSALAVDLSLVVFADPRSIDGDRVRKTKNQIERLNRDLLPLLREQNSMETSGLSLEVEHLAKNIEDELGALESSLTQQCSDTERFETLHLRPECRYHTTATFHFYGGGSIDVNLCLINDVELLCKRLGSVFYCIGANEALSGLNGVLAFMSTLRGISPIPHPDLYVTSVPCVQCLREIELVPNQGCSLLAVLADRQCDHLCKKVRAEPIYGLFETELGQLGLKITQRSAAKRPVQTTADQLRESSLAAMQDHNIFKHVSASIMELSNLIYWNAGQAGLHTGNEHSCSQMAKLLTHEADMHEHRALIAHGRRAAHFYDRFRPDPIESLFCGGLFNSIDDTIDALSRDCSVTFFQQANYTNVMRKQNELFTRLNSILRRGGADSQKRTASSEPRTAPVAATAASDVLKDAQYRREQYMKKVAKDGFKKLTECLQTQSAVLADALCMRVWGGVAYDEASKLVNHFLLRRRFVALPWETRGGSEQVLFENSKYIKNSLYPQRLSREHVEIITLQFYDLITGPLTRQSDLFPSPANVALAQCFEAAGMLPHHKMLVSEMIWPQIQPKDWIDQTFNRFYQLPDGDLNAVQKSAWCFIRELVLSVALYNRTWEKTLRISSLARGETSIADLDVKSLTSGLYLTYERDAPLVLIAQNTGWIFKDLYALLYHHLQLSDGHGN
ncbi:ORF7 [macacine gammaherpesvirus 12]|uniref:ORF7 n=1 Tax=macacine gammaherpesvirus 12 TaxID=2560571 RepID=A0A0B5D3H9_9GAMA|nr:ORF7 [Macaca nemestrina rhadinovirus 2]AJE29646.1 ORF7 [Macaca nemestrina rhadinovirus 2]